MKFAQYKGEFNSCEIISSFKKPKMFDWLNSNYA